MNPNDNRQRHTSVEWTDDQRSVDESLIWHLVLTRRRYIAQETIIFVDRNVNDHLICPNVEIVHQDRAISVQDHFFRIMFENMEYSNNYKQLKVKTGNLKKTINIIDSET